MLENNIIQLYINDNKIELLVKELSNCFNNFILQKRFKITSSCKLKKNDIGVIEINFDNYEFKTIESDEGLTIGCYENESQLLYIGLNIDYPNAKILFSNNKIIIKNLRIDLDLKLGIAINTKDDESDDSLWYGADPNYFSD